MKTLILLLISLSAFNLFSQAPNTKDGNYRVHGNFGLGTSIMGGLSIYTDAQFNVSKHNFGINLYHNWHTGSFGNYLSWQGPDPDKFTQIGIFYGRSFSFKRFYATFNIGPGYYTSIKGDRIAQTPIVTNLPDGSTHSTTAYLTEYNPYQGIGVTVVSDVSLFVSEKSALGLLIYSNYNKNNTMRSISISYKFNFLNLKN
jgi:hypothetical protein